MGTKKQVLTEIDDIIGYLSNTGHFHDYRLGRIQLLKDRKVFTIEENKHKGSARIWKISCVSLSDLDMEFDTELPAYITGIEIYDHVVSISLDNGYISFKALGLKLEIPTY